MLSAARQAIKNGVVAVAPVSGFHHSSFDAGGSYCTFNGLMVTAAVLLQEGEVTHMGILDLDHHFGDGTDNIIKELGLEQSVLHFSAGANWYKPNQAELFLQLLPSIVEEFARCDVLIAQLAADPHVADELGGWMTTQQLMQRDSIVFETARQIGLPVAWCLGGGYQVPLRKVLAIHDNTLKACASAFLGMPEGINTSGVA